jgi:hypothetical protein
VSVKNYSLLKMLVLEEILGDRTTLEMSKLLGFKFDKYKRWLDNSKIMKWDEFEFLCQKVGIKFKDSFEMLLYYPDTLNDKNFFIFLKDYNVFSTHPEIADYLKTHVSVIQRYVKNETIPDVETIFKLIGKKPHILGPFIQKLFPHGVKGSLLLKWIEEDMGDLVAKNQHPLGFIICYLVQFDSYKNKDIPSDQWIASKLDHDLEEIQFVLKGLVESNVLKLENDHYSVTNTSQIVQNMNALPREELLPTLIYLNKKIIDIFEKSKDSSHQIKKSNYQSAFGFSINALNKKQMDKVNQLVFKTTNEMEKIFDEDVSNDVDDPKIEVRAMLFQIFTLANPNK